MSTRRPGKRRIRSEAGLTIPEVLIGLALAGLLAGLVSVPLVMTNKLSRRSLDRVVEAVDSNLSIQLLNRHISASQLVRTKVFSCSGLSRAFKTESTGQIILKPGSTDQFTLPFVSQSSIGSIPYSGTNEIHVSDATLYYEGDLVAIVGADNPENVGFFKIADVNEVQSKIKLTEASIAPSGTDCLPNGAPLLSYAGFKQAATNAGQRTVFVQKFHMAIYQVRGDDISLRIYPQAMGDSQMMSVFKGFRSFRMDTAWQKRGMSDTHQEIEGTFRMQVFVELAEPELDATRSSVTCKGKGSASTGNSFCENDQLFHIRRLETYGRYVLASSERLNPQVQTNAVPEATVFPTCYIRAQKAGGVFDFSSLPAFPTDPSRRLYVVSGGVSEASLGTVNISVTPYTDPGQSIYCVNREDLKTLPGNKVPIHTSEFMFSGNYSPTSNTWNEMLCSVKGKVELRGALRYYDPGMKKSAIVTCLEVIQ